MSVGRRQSVSVLRGVGVSNTLTVGSGVMPLRDVDVSLD